MKTLRIEMEDKNCGLEIELPEKCECGFPNLHIWGTRTNGRLRIEVRCIRCGKLLSKLEREGD